MPDNVNDLPPITSPQAFVDFVTLLRADFRENGTQWENRNLSDYLEAMQAWTADMDGYYINTGQPIPDNVPWHIFADILRAARMYK
jgi:hypothetical protein